MNISKKKLLISLTNIKKSNEVISRKEKRKGNFEIAISFKVNTLIKAGVELREVSFAVTFSWVHGVFASVRRFFDQVFPAYSRHLILSFSLAFLPRLTFLLSSSKRSQHREQPSIYENCPTSRDSNEMEFMRELARK